METCRFIAALFLWLICVQVNASENHLIGSLFLTPAQRDQLDASGQTTPGLPQLVAPGSIRFNGSVRRSSGNRTGWLNGKRLSRFESSEALGQLRLSADKLLVERPEGTEILKAGESFSVTDRKAGRRIQ